MKKISAMKKILSSLLVCVALVSVSIAQDPNFSQFFASPLTLNPALTGKFDGVVRVAGNFRNQWPTINNAFVTKTASVDFGILKNRLSEIDQLGVGILGVSDNAGDGVLVTNYGGLSLAYHKGLDEDGYHQIGAGFQAKYYVVDGILGRQENHGHCFAFLADGPADLNAAYARQHPV